jgi:hypothetical protein
MGVIGDMGAFQQYQMGQAMTAAANNPSGGGAAEGMGLGMGFAMANQMFGAGGQPGAQVGAGRMAPGAAGGGGAPPPLPPASPWHAAVGGQSVGPMPLAQLVQQIQGGQIERETLVWTAGMESWSPAGEVPQLAGYFQAAPPPLPQS